MFITGGVNCIHRINSQRYRGAIGISIIVAIVLFILSAMNHLGPYSWIGYTGGGLLAVPAFGAIFYLAFINLKAAKIQRSHANIENQQQETTLQDTENSEDEKKSFLQVVAKLGYELAIQYSIDHRDKLLDTDEELESVIRLAQLAAIQNLQQQEENFREWVKNLIFTEHLDVNNDISKERLLEAPKGTINTVYKKKNFLHLAAEGGYTTVIPYLIDEGANLLDTDEDGNMPLHLAAQGYHLHAFHLLKNKMNQSTSVVIRLGVNYLNKVKKTAHALCLEAGGKLTPSKKHYLGQLNSWRGPVSAG